MRRLITWASFRLGNALASPWTILFFAVVSLTALPQTIAAAAHGGDVTILVGWFSQNFVQLVSLSILAFIADSQGRAAQKRSDEMYEWMHDWHERHAAKLEAIHQQVNN